MKEDKLIPKRRFKEFENDEAWEQRKLGEHCEMYNGDRGINYPNERDMVSDGIPFINAGDLKNGKVNLSDANKITREKYSKLGGAKLQLGDIVYCLRGTLGKNAFIDNFDEGTVASSLVALRPKNIDGKYLFHILNSDIEYRQRTICDEGAAQPNLSAKSLGTFDIPVPKIEEQKKIATFFTNLDNIITLHQRKLKKMKDLKSAYLSEMFPKEGEEYPKRRFAGFTDPWEQRKLLDSVIKIIDFRGRTPKKLGLDWSDEGYLALSALNVKNGYIDKSIDAHYGNEELYDAWMTGNELHQGQVLFTTEAPMGNVAQVPDNRRYILSQRTIAFEVDEGIIAEDYLAVVLGSPNIFNRLTSLSSGGTAKGVSQKSLSELTIPIPNTTEEQIKIGSLFKHIDNLVTLHQRKLEKLEYIKKAYLNEMFV